ncbi:MAG: DNA alkylation repair protein [Candidatus Pacearchaeota archaeon]
MFEKIESELKILKNPDRIPIYQNFFKTGKGEYAEGDVFFGISVPLQRKIAQKYVGASFNDVKSLLLSKIHEFRLTGFFILLYKFEIAKDEREKREIIDFYLDNIHCANNWDLIDCVAHKLLGRWLIDKDKSLLYNYAKSDNLWKKRIAIISTLHFIKSNKFSDSLKISKMLLSDDQDLIHKAVGWILREIGKRDEEILREFLKENYYHMSRTTLRYAIERFPERKRLNYLKGKF